MQAHIRAGSRHEFPGILRPQVCAIDDYVHYTFRPWKYEVAIPSLDLVFKAGRRNGNLIYELPSREELTIVSSNRGWVFDGEGVHERWPTPQRRELVCGSRVFRVKPEDDTLWFNFTDEVPDLATAIIGFYIYLGNPDSATSS